MASFLRTALAEPLAPVNLASTLTVASRSFYNGIGNSPLLRKEGEGLGMTAQTRRTVNGADLTKYFDKLRDLLCSTEVTSANGAAMDYGNAVDWAMNRARAVHAAGNKLIFVGNGGSAAIASHMATDYSKNGGVRSLAFNDSSMLTCLGNDLGYDRVFAKQIELHARAGDLVFAISSSGRSPNILNAVAAAADAGCCIITLSGFTPDNPLRAKGEVNFYIASDRYGFVEIGHLTICHAILDYLCGLPTPDEQVLSEVL